LKSDYEILYIETIDKTVKLSPQACAAWEDHEAIAKALIDAGAEKDDDWMIL